MSRFGILYAGAQKNIVPSGLAIAIVRDDLLEPGPRRCAVYLRLPAHRQERLHVQHAPTYAWYLAGLVFEWLKEQGGLAAMEAQQKEKADFLYGYLDQSNFYGNKVDVACRSRMNVPFQLKNLGPWTEAVPGGVGSGRSAGPQGHRIVGGMRASLYNAPCPWKGSRPGQLYG